MNVADLQKEAVRMGYQLTQVDSSYLLKRERVSDGRKVVVSGTDGSIQIEMQVGDQESSKYARFVFGDAWKAFLKLRDVDGEVFGEDNAQMFDPENVRAARMVQEVRSLTLSPEDRLLVVVRDDASVFEMDEVANVFSRWMGDKGHNRVMVTRKVEVIEISLK